MASGLGQMIIGILSWTLRHFQGSIPLCFIVWGVILGEWSGASIVLLAVVASWALYAIGDRLWRLPAAAPFVFEETNRLSQMVGLPTPGVYVVESDQINASSMTAFRRRPFLAITSTAQHLPSRELSSVIGHELAHIIRRDSLLKTVILTAIGLTAAPLILLDLEVWYLPFALLILVIFSWFIEFRADSKGAKISGEPSALADTLRKMNQGRFLLNLLSPLYLTGFIIAAYILKIEGFKYVPHQPAISIWLPLLIAFVISLAIQSHPPVFFRTLLLRNLAARRL